jgi:uncharacterized protein YjbI with pentapeptide repeats
MEVLTAYVRQHAPWRQEEELQRVEEDTTPEKSEQNSSGESKILEAPAADIQAIITVLRRRIRTAGHGEPEGLNLRRTNLARANLSGANLSGADLWEANLSGADHLTQDQLEETTGNANTRLPPDLKPPKHWGVQTDEQTEGD